MQKIFLLLICCCMHLVGMEKKVRFETFSPRYPKLKRSYAQIITERDEQTQLTQERLRQEKFNRAEHEKELTELYGPWHQEERRLRMHMHRRKVFQKIKNESDRKKAIEQAVVATAVITTAIVITYILTNLEL